MTPQVVGYLVGTIMVPAYYENTDNTEEYTERYEVIPKVESQTLRTKGKRLTEDIIVTEIPCFDVSNEAGGTTIYIAKE